MSVSGSAAAFDSATSKVVDLKALQAEIDLNAPIAELDRDLVGLAPVKQRIREIAAFLLVARASGSRTHVRSAHATYGLHRQSRHWQDHGGAAYGEHPSSSRLHTQRPSRFSDA